MDVLPLFYSDSSKKSLLTVSESKDVTPGGADSIIALSKSAGLKQCILISSDFSDFIPFWKNCKKEGLEAIFGLELHLCNNMEEKTQESLKTEHKVYIFLKNAASYTNLIKIYSKAARAGFYYKPRLDAVNLKAFWHESLSLAIPFFDSFLWKNTLVHGAAIIPDFPSVPRFFKEINSGLPFEEIICDSIDKYSDKIINTKTIYYTKYSDIKAYTTYRSILNRSSFHKPNLDYLCSNTFCFEDYLKCCK